MDRLTGLTVFGSVVDSGGFSAAARRLNMSVTMVSNHVQALEDRLGVRLLNRSTRKVSLTEVGRSYYERSQQVLADLDEADRVATALHATPRGTLRLHASMNLVRFLAPIVSEFLTLPGFNWSSQRCVNRRQDLTRRHVGLRLSWREPSLVILLFDHGDHSLAPTKIRAGVARRCGP